MTTPTCPYCSRPAKLVTGLVIYPHRPDLEHKKFYQCAPCNAYVGTHETTGEPFGTLANASLRLARNEAHQCFDPTWKVPAEREYREQFGKLGRVKRMGVFVKQHRTAAYERLAKDLGIEMKDCHIGMFDVDTCKWVVRICMAWTDPDREAA